MKVNAEDVTYFHVLAHAGTLVRAGQELGVDHTTVSRRIQRLEHALGIRLFTRTRTGWTLTSNGASLLPAARTVALGMELFAEGDPSRIGPEEWTVLTSDGFAANILAPRCGDLLADGRITLHVVSAPSLASREGVSYDVAVVRSRPSAASVRSRLLASYEIGLYASQNYLTRHPPIRTLADLEDHVVCWYPEDPIAGIPEFDALRQKLPKCIRLQSNNLNVHAQAAVAGVGLAVMPTYTAESNDSLVRVLPDEMNYQGRYWSVLPAAQLRWEVTHRVLEFLRDAVRDAGLIVPKEE